MSDVLVMGCGLIGTSLALALQGSELGDVTLADASEEALAGALQRRAGRRWDGQERATIAVVAVPPRSTAAALVELQRRDVAQTYTHVASVQSQVQREIEALTSDASSVVGGHPLAGREVSGPAAAVLDLFVGRPWAVCPGTSSRSESVRAVEYLAQLCGATPVHVTPDEHDRSVALLSHLPQVVSSALAGLLVAGAAAQPPVELSGPGLADSTRLAAGDPDLWTEILLSNAQHVSEPLALLADRLAGVAAALAGAQGDASGTAAARSRLHELIVEGNRGRALVPVKRGRMSDDFVAVRVVMADEPGQLAALLADAARAGVNVEDVHVEHVPGRPQGVIELLVAARHAAHLVEALRADSWDALSAS